MQHMASLPILWGSSRGEGRLCLFLRDKVPSRKNQQAGVGAAAACVHGAWQAKPSETPVTTTYYL